MRVLISCPGCKATQAASCQPGCTPADGHVAGCLNADWDAALTCVPGAGCCPENHHHGQAADACPGAGHNHHGAPCPEDNPLACVAVTPAGEGCPGGHCGKGVDGCTVCRPVRIDIISLGVPLGSVS